MPQKGKGIEDISVGQIVLDQNNREVKLMRDTVWLNLNQVTKLFERANLLSPGICEKCLKQKSWKESTVAFSSSVQKERGRTIERTPSSAPSDFKSGAKFYAVSAR